MRETEWEPGGPSPAPGRYCGRQAQPWHYDHTRARLFLSEGVRSLLAPAEPRDLAGLAAAFDGESGARLARALETRVPFDLELCLPPDPAGRSAGVRIAGEWLTDGTGMPEALIGTLTPASGHAAEATLIDPADACFRSFAKAMPQVVWTSTPDGSPEFLSGALAGDGDPFAAAARWETGIHSADRTIAARRWRQSLRDGADFEAEIRVAREPGHGYSWYRTFARPAEFAGLAERLELALDAAHIGVFERRLDSDRYIYDHRIASLYQIGPETEWTRGYLLSRMHPEDTERFIREAAEADGMGETLTTTYRVQDRDGKWHTHRSHSRVVTDPDGTRRVIGVIRDVTEEFERIAELEARRREAEAATAARSHFLAVMSHEIRTPLNGVLGMAALLGTTALGEQQRQMLGVIQNSGEMLMTVLNDILDFSKIESGSIAFDPRPFAPLDLLVQTARLHRPRAEEKGLAFATEIEGDAQSRRLGDPVRLAQVLNNLVSNGIKFTETGSVTLRFGGLSPSLVVFEVADTGIGMTPEQVERIFDPFAQGDSTIARRFGGTGLGLSITDRIVKAMGGRIEVETRPAVGTLMRVTVPLPVAGPEGEGT